MRFLQDKYGSLQEVFFDYFADNMTAAEAKNFHEHKLQLAKVPEADFADGSQNPTRDTVTYWLQQWRLTNLGTRSGPQLIAVSMNFVNRF